MPAYPPELSRHEQGIQMSIAATVPGLIRASLHLAAACAVLLACNSPPTRPQPSTAVPFGKTVDLAFGWSHDGKYIAFRRNIPSSIGPPGVYVVPSNGGAPHFVMPADHLWPQYIRFTRDGEDLVGIYAGSVIMVSIATGEIRQPTMSEHGANYPDTSPLHDLIVYSRVLSGDPATPDSGGIHIFDPVKGVDRAIHPNIWGRYPRWSPDGRSIFLVVNMPSGRRIVRVDSSGSGGAHRTVGPGSSSHDTTAPTCCVLMVPS
jgi:Tol biopolymer transport system component